MNKFLYISALCTAISLPATGFAAEVTETSASIVNASYALPAGAGEEIRKNMREVEEENRSALKKDMEKDHAELIKLLVAADFDRKAYLEKAKDLRKLEDEARENQDDALAAAAVQLSADDRRTFVNALEGKGASHARKHAKGGDDRFTAPVGVSKLSPSAGGN